MDRGAPLVHARGVQLRTADGARPLLRSLDWRVEAGAAVAVTGPSGCGKSTLLQAIAGLHPIAAGELRVCGRALHTAGAGERARLRATAVGLVLQNLNLLPALTALENIALGGIYSDVPRDELRRRAGVLLEAVGLGGRGGARPAALSLGEQQRIAIARALVHGPALVLADEPTASLDRAAGAQLVSLIMELCGQRAAALLLVTHDPAIAALLPAGLHLPDWAVA